MELDFEKTCFSCLKQDVYPVKSQEQTMEVRIPEGMPEVGRVIGSWGQCILRGKEWQGGRIGITGGVMARVLYLPVGGDQLQSMEAWIPFQEKWELADRQGEGRIRVRCLLKALDARMLSGRKIGLRAALESFVEAFEPSQFCEYAPKELPEDVQLLRREYPMLLPKEAGEKSFSLDEDMEAGSAQRLLYCTVEPKITRQQVVGDKLSVIGVLKCHFLFDLGDNQLQPRDGEIEFSQLAELEQEYEQEAEASVTFAVTSLETDLQEGRVRIKCGLIGQYVVWDRQALEMVEDAFSPVRMVEMKEEAVQLPAILDTAEQSLKTESVLNIPCGEVVDTNMLAEHPVVHQRGDMADLEARGSVQVLYRDLAGELQSSNGRWSTQLQIPTDATVNMIGELTAGQVCRTDCDEDRLVVTTQVDLRTRSIAGGGMNRITGLELGESEPADPARPSLIMCRKGDQSLWDLAKRNGSTVESIKRANHLKDEPAEDRILLIPVS